MSRARAARTRRWARRLALGVTGGVAVLVAVWFATGPPAPDERLRVFVARRILTLEPDRPEATAVAVASGRIVAVGSLDEVRASLAARPFELDASFRDHVLVPGFIDPHIHPTLAATILPIEIVSALEWTTPRGRTRAVRGREDFLARLRELDAQLRERGEPEAWLSVWGYHAPYHGSLSRRDLDAVSEARPIFVWQRSVHEMFFNTRALAALGLSREAFDAHPQADWERGHLWERGTLSLGVPMTRVLARPLTYRRGLALMSEVIHRG
ncbi:MAG: amidohydrolase family protein, partial [Deltaproteobacteria bacterium]